MRVIRGSPFILSFILLGATTDPPPTVAQYQTVISALIAASVSGGVGYLTYRRSSRAVKAEREERASQAANEQIEVIRAAWESVVAQLKAEIDRLLETRRREREQWAEKEVEFRQEIVRLSEEVERHRNKIEALEAELARVERRNGYRDNRGIGEQVERRRTYEDD